jgi:hypothetical protein
MGASTKGTGSGTAAQEVLTSAPSGSRSGVPAKRRADATVQGDRGAVVKRSVTLAARNVMAVEEIVGKGEFSKFVDQAVSKELERVRFDALLGDLRSRHGAVTSEERVAARSALRSAGLELSTSE